MRRGAWASESRGPPRVTAPPGLAQHRAQARFHDRGNFLEGYAERLPRSWTGARCWTGHTIVDGRPTMDRVRDHGSAVGRDVVHGMDAQAMSPGPSAGRAAGHRRHEAGCSVTERPCMAHASLQVLLCRGLGAAAPGRARRSRFLAGPFLAGPFLAGPFLARTFLAGPDHKRSKQLIMDILMAESECAVPFGPLPSPRCRSNPQLGTPVPSDHASTRRLLPPLETTGPYPSRAFASGAFPGGPFPGGACPCKPFRAEPSRPWGRCPTCNFGSRQGGREG